MIRMITDDMNDTDDTDPIDSFEYDYVIVGAGPACAGLLAGLFRHDRREEAKTGEDESESSSASPVLLRVAVLERGPVTIRSDSDEKDRHDYNNNKEKKEETEEAVTVACRIHEWFAASHSHSPFLHPHTRLYPGMNAHTGRVLTVPMGHGVGGGALINAGVCMPPLPTDVLTWPALFRTHLRPACHYIQHAMLDDHDRRNHNIHETMRGNNNNHTSTSNDNYNSNNDDIRKTYWQGLVQHTPWFWQHVTLIHGQAERLLVAEEGIDCLPRVTGVEYSPSPSPSSVDDSLTTSFLPILMARREVILCAGALETPALLLVSNIGTPTASSQHHHYHSSHRTTTTKDIDSSTTRLPIGEMLRDHVALSRAMYCVRGKGSRHSNHIIRTQATTNTTGSTIRNGLISLQNVMVHNDYDDIDNDEANNDDRNNDNGDKRQCMHHPQHIFQIGVFDGSLYDSILPSVCASWFHWDWNNVMWRSQWLWRHALVLLLQRLLKVVRRCVYTALTLALCPGSPLLAWLRAHVFTVTIFLMNPTSVGRVSIVRRAKEEDTASGMHSTPSLRRRDVTLNIQLNYLSTSADLAAMRKGWQESYSLVVPEIQRHLHTQGIEVFPACLIRKGMGLGECMRWIWSALSCSTLRILLFVRRSRQQQRPPVHSHPHFYAPPLDERRFHMFAHATCLPYFHWCGTCRISSAVQVQPIRRTHNDDDPPSSKSRRPEQEHDMNLAVDHHHHHHQYGGVVDDTLKVHGYQGLRICDASVFPTCVSAPIALTCAALGYVCGSKLLLPSPPPPVVLESTIIEEEEDNKSSKQGTIEDTEAAAAGSDTVL